MDDSMNSYRKGEGGQVSLVFIASLVIIMAALTLLVDGGRYLVMRNRARMMADASALSGAGILDLEKAQEGYFVLDIGLARQYASSIFNENYLDKPDWADYQLQEVRIIGNEIWVTVAGTSTPLFGSNLGLNYSVTIVSSARAASGISSEK
jgi:hypothetical protein